MVSLLFAFQIRKVKVKGVNDAKYIAAAIYVTSIILAVTILSIYTLEDNVNGYVAVFGLGLLVGSAAIVALVFVPKVGAVVVINIGMCSMLWSSCVCFFIPTLVYHASALIQSSGCVLTRTRYTHPQIKPRA